MNQDSYKDTTSDKKEKQSGINCLVLLIGFAIFFGIGYWWHNQDKDKMRSELTIYKKKANDHSSDYYTPQP